MSESVTAEVSPEKSMRTQERLSALIESLGEHNRDEDVDDLISGDQDIESIVSTSSSDQFEPLRPQVMGKPDPVYTPPEQKLPSSSSSSSAQIREDPHIRHNNTNTPVAENKVEFALSPPHVPNTQSEGVTPQSNDDYSRMNSNNRFSMMSDYSGVVHEGTEVSYVVKNTLDNTTTNTNNNGSSSLKSHSSTSSEPIIQNDVVIKQIKNAKLVNRFNSLHSDTPSKPPRTNLKYYSDPLLLIQDQTKQLSLQESTTSTDANPGINSIRNLDHEDSFSIQSSVVPPLATTTNTLSQEDKFMDPSISDFNHSNNNNSTNTNNDNSNTDSNVDVERVPTIPPRNKNRPRTIILDEDYNVSPSQPPPSAPERSPKREQNGENTHPARQFNAHTISQLLSMTNGTLIGSEFQDLPIPTEEKRSLERLVDSLSRLTADMVLDPERYEEGLVRLKRAIRALEGFN